MKNENKQLIPKNIVQYWSDKNLSDNLKVLSNSWSEVYPDYNYQLYNRDSAIDFLIENYDEHIVESFKSLKIAAMQSDFFRVAYILAKGGMYIDLSHKAHKRVDGIIDLNADTLYIFTRPTGAIWNGYIVAPPNNQALKSIFERILGNISRKESCSAYQVTGPGNFNRLLSNENSTIIEKQLLWKFLRGDKLYQRNNKHWSKVTNIEDAYS
ncbi:glycosyltransferase [Psychrobacter sp. Ps2]|uniref:glycosyltransferase family 32 protein n=1 Tax=Psychrobacter sp. Ps2 TaxID=2790956 RepID=UPI001EE01B87|nr:glycosyltransferase [Psychrobacter sp. Ps2]MCG3858890.1 hypothetical protein [Psychrobacter sp. Ps2]